MTNTQPLNGGIGYTEFLREKIKLAKPSGFEVSQKEINPMLKPHQRDIVQWALRGGRRAIFASFGLGKTFMQCEIMRLVHAHTGGRTLIVCPLGVRQEFKRDGFRLGVDFAFVRRTEEVARSSATHFLTNYESVREGKLDVTMFDAVSLDEASVLRSFGSKTYQTFLPLFESVPYRFVATATPAPNRYKELIHYAGYLGIMDTGQALTRFFQRDSTKANNLTLYPHKEREFYLWLHSWAVFLNKPSELGYSDEGYDLPELKVIYHPVSAAASELVDRDGQHRLFCDAALGLTEAAKEKRRSMMARVAEMKAIIDADPDSHYIIWHDLEDERRMIERALPEAVSVYGSQDLEERERSVIAFSDGEIQYLATKPELSGSGCNFQRYCHKAIFLGIGYKFNDFIQSIHRIYRFLQQYPCEIHIIYADSEQEILQVLKNKWREYDELQVRMSELVRRYGLNRLGGEVLTRTIGVRREISKGRHYEVAHNDAVEEARLRPDNSMHLIITSIPFSNQYEYTPSYNDFGHTDDNAHFWAQMDYLTPELFRILAPGRLACIHVKDRVLFGNVTGAGLPTISPFHAEAIFHYLKHGFDYMGMITVVTDVVRENNQTYRLGWTEQCKDGTKMGVGSPEYVLLFHKPQSDRTRGYADVPVKKSKAEYSRARWQVDAHAFWRSSGNRALTADELKGYGPDVMAKVFRQYSLEHIYDYAEHVKVGEELERKGKLPATFMAIAPASHAPDVWDDVARMQTLNSEQTRRGLQNHVCLAKGSLILTRNGYKPIEAIEIGDVVLTHKGNWKPVIAKRCTGVNPVIQTKAQGVANLITTPDHKLWARITDKVRVKDYMQKTAPAWIEAQNCKGGYVNLKLPEVEENNLTLQEWWLVGRYLADGHKGTRGDYFISVGKGKETDFEIKASGYFGSYAERTAKQYRLKNVPEPLKQMLDACGRGAENKQVPIAGLCTDKASAQALLDGYLSGDGNKTGNAVRATSVSRALLLGMAMVAQRALNVIPSVYKGKSAGKAIIEGREVNCKQCWVMSWRESAHHHEGIILADGAWKKVKEPLNCGEAETWSIQVADDASYTAEGCIVKNCPLQFDIVDRLIERYSNKGEVVYDPFGGIMTVPYRAVLLGRYGMASELSEEYFHDGVRNLVLADTDQSIPSLFDMEAAVND